MVIKKIEEREMKRLELDLTGPDGNAFALLGHAKNLAEQLGKDHKAIWDKMRAGDYENLVKVFDEEFGEHVTLYR